MLAPLRFSRARTSSIVSRRSFGGVYGRFSMARL
jgi:hypothetical protein